jgi:hypothetical protein
VESKTYHAGLRTPCDLYTKFQQTTFEPSGKLVDSGQFGEIMGKSKGSRCGKEARLSHPSTKSLPKPAGAVKEHLASNQTRTNGGTWKAVSLAHVSYTFETQTVVLT